MVFLHCSFPGIALLLQDSVVSLSKSGALMNVAWRFAGLLFTGVLLLIAGCGDEDDPVTPKVDYPTITVTGTVQVKPGLQVPEGSLLTAVWSVDSSPDYAYVFGKGTVNTADMTFSITFDTPPQQALNIPSAENGGAGIPPLGVGYICLGDFTSNEPHMLGEDEMDGTVLGAVSNIGVIYVGGAPSLYAQFPSLTWPAAFRSGYSLGEGQETGEMHDIFVPTSASSFVLTVTDDPSDLTFPNWK
jgi:hypothetical protein